MTMPTWTFQIIDPQLPFLENCLTTIGLGTLTFTIDGIDYDLPSHHFMERFVDVFQ
jgi:hypothetical protein